MGKAILLVFFFLIMALWFLSGLVELKSAKKKVEIGASFIFGLLLPFLVMVGLITGFIIRGIGP